jgi:hypothetical protein
MIPEDVPYGLAVTSTMFLIVTKWFVCEWLAAAFESRPVIKIVAGDWTLAAVHAYLLKIVLEQVRFHAHPHPTPIRIQPAGPPARTDARSTCKHNHTHAKARTRGHALTGARAAYALVCVCVCKCVCVCVCV